MALLLPFHQKQITVKVEPVFHEDAPNDLRIDFEAHIRLRCDAKWVQIPQHMVLMHAGREFGVLVDTTFRGLSPGAHFTEVSCLSAQRFCVPCIQPQLRTLPSHFFLAWSAGQM